MKHFFLCFILTWVTATRLLKEAYADDDLKEQGVSTELWTPNPDYDFGPEDLTLDRLSTKELKAVLNGLEELNEVAVGGNEEVVGEDYYPNNVLPQEEWEVGVPENDLTRYFDKKDLDAYYQGDLSLDELFDVVDVNAMIPSRRRRLGDSWDQIDFDENGEYEQPPLEYFIADKPESEEQTAGNAQDHDSKLAQAPEVKDMVKKPEKKEEEGETPKTEEEADDKQVSQNEDDEAPAPPTTVNEANDAVDNVQQANDDVKKAKDAVQDAEKKKADTEAKEQERLDKMTQDLASARAKLQNLNVNNAVKEETEEDKKLQGLNNDLQREQAKLDGRTIDQNPALVHAGQKRQELDREELKKKVLMDKMRAAQKDLDTQDKRLIEKKKEAAREAMDTAARLQREANEAKDFARETDQEVNGKKKGDQPEGPKQEEEDDTDNDGTDDENPSKTPPEDQDVDDDDEMRRPPRRDNAGDEDEYEDDEKAGPTKDDEQDEDEGEEDENEDEHEDSDDDDKKPPKTMKNPKKRRRRRRRKKKKHPKIPQTDDVEPDELEDESESDDNDEDEEKPKRDESDEQDEDEEDYNPQTHDEDEYSPQHKITPPKDEELRHLEKIHRAASNAHEEMQDRLDDLRAVQGHMDPRLKRNLMRRLRRLRMAFGDFNHLQNLRDHTQDPRMKAELRGRLRGLARRVQRAKMIVSRLQQKHFHPGRMVLHRDRSSDDEDHHHTDSDDDDSDNDDTNIDDEEDKSWDHDQFNQKLARLRAHYGEPMPGMESNPIRAKLRKRIVALLRPHTAAMAHPFIPPPRPFPCRQPAQPRTKICKSTACPCGFTALHWSLIDGCYNVEGDCAPCGRNSRKIKAVGFSYSFNQVAQKRLPMFAYRRQGAPWNFTPRYKTSCPGGKVLVAIGAKVQDFGGNFKHQLRIKCARGCPFQQQELPPMPNLVHVIRRNPSMIHVIRPIIRHKIVTMRPPPEIIHPIIQRILTPGVHEEPPPVIHSIIHQIVQHPRVVQHPIIRRIIRRVVQRPQVVHKIIQHPALIQRPVIRKIIQRPRVIMKVVKHPQIVHRIIAHMINPSQQPAMVVHHHHLPSGPIQILRHPEMPSHSHHIIIHGDQVGEESKKHKDEANSSSHRAALRKRLLPKIRKRLKGNQAMQKSDSSESMKDDLRNLLLGDESTKTDA